MELRRFAECFVTCLQGKVVKRKMLFVEKSNESEESKRKGAIEDEECEQA